MNAAARALRLDQDQWRWLEDQASTAGATAIVLGAYLMFAFDRFGWPDFAVQPTARFLLAGFYGWMWLALASWMLGRAVGGSREPPAAILRLTGHAHLPLLLIAVLIQVVSVMANATNVLAVPALLMAVVWFPGLLAQAVAAASERSVGKAALIVAGPFLVWAGVVGRMLWRQLGHLV